MSPSDATNEATRREWRELGFYYATETTPPHWRIVGSPPGLARFVSLLQSYVGDPRNAALSEHEHYGPYMYLKITTWSAAEIDGDGIRGSIADLARLKDLVEGRLRIAEPGDSFVIGAEYAKAAAYPLWFEVRGEDFDPASADPELEPHGESL